MKCSIIIPVYNMERYIARALNSVKEQSYQSIEVIIIDDGSTDQSADRIKDLIKNDARFVYHHYPNGGLGKARNHGLRLSTGEFIIFLDADDWIDRDYVSDCVKIVDNNDVIIQPRIMHYTETERYITYPKSPKNLFSDINLSCTNKIFSRKYIADLSFTENMLYEDVAFHLNLMNKKPNFKLGNSVYHVEKRNERSITSVMSERHVDLLLNFDSSGKIVEKFDKKTLRDYEYYVFKSSLYLIANFKVCSLPIWKHINKFILIKIVRKRHYLKFLLFAAVCTPRWVFVMRKRYKQR